MSSLIPSVSVIVVSYNTKEMTLACLKSIFEQTQSTTFEILLLDNASSDGSVQAIRSEFSDSVNIVASDKNLGFAAGNNLISKRAVGDYILLLNPDTVVLDRAIDRLVAFAQSWPDAGIWGGRTLGADGTLDPTSCFSRQTLWSLFCQVAGLNIIFRSTNLFNPEDIGGWDRTGERRVDIVCGCFLLIRRDIWNRLGGFNKLFFMYGEEADLCIRAQSIGCRPFVSSTATIVHYGGASERIKADKIVRLLKAKIALIDEHFVPAQKRLAKWLLAMWPLSRYLGHTLLALIGKKSSLGQRDVWREVIKSKSEWIMDMKAEG